VKGLAFGETFAAEGVSTVGEIEEEICLLRGLKVHKAVVAVKPLQVSHH